VFHCQQLKIFHVCSSVCLASNVNYQAIFRATLKKEYKVIITTITASTFTNHILKGTSLALPFQMTYLRGDKIKFYLEICASCLQYGHH
jgi:hypothetical protein